ncbi:hypothetical protein ACOME3_009039 [Neoechinorhynchus agilis]
MYTNIGNPLTFLLVILHFTQVIFMKETLDDPYEEYRRRYEENLNYNRLLDDRTTEQWATNNAADADHEYQQRLEEYRRQLAEYERNIQRMPQTNEPIDTVDHYYEGLGDHYKSVDRTNNEYEQYSPRNEPYRQESTHSPVVYQQYHDHVQSHDPSNRKDSYGGNMNHLVEYLPFSLVPNAFLKWMDAERPSHISNEKYANGKFVFECSEGYEHDKSGPPLDVYCRSGHLSELPRCKRIQVCSGIPKPTHGAVDLQNSRILDAHRPDLFRVGTIFAFRCNKYAQTDPALPRMRTECVNGGVWSHYPKCVALTTCDFYTYLNVIQKPTVQLVVVYKNVTIMKSPLHHGGYNAIVGSTIKHRCSNGYRHDPQSGPLDVVCQPNGHWTRLPNCELIDEFKGGCSDLPNSAVIQNHNLVPRLYKISQAGGFIVGNITFICKENFQPFDADESPMTISCRGGSWTHLPRCSLRPLCSAGVRLPEKAKVTGSKLFFIPGYENQGYLPGSFIAFSCRKTSDTGGQIIKSGQVSCMTDGTWNLPVQC